MVIENKIYSGEKKGQLEDYRKKIDFEYKNYKHKIYIYLSLSNQEISESQQEFYVQLNYEHIIKIIEEVFSNQRLMLPDKIKFIFEQYLQTLKSMLNKNDEIEFIAKNLYKKYKSSFDLVFKYVTNDYTVISNKLKELIEKEETVKLFESNNTYVRFQPTFLYDNIERLKNKGLLLETDDLENNWIFLYEFNIRKDKVNFDCKIGEGNQEIRNKLYDIYKRNTNIFKKVDRNLSSKWHLSFQKNILSKNDMEDYFESSNVEELEKKLTEKFRELINIDLPKLIDVIEKELNT